MSENEAIRINCRDCAKPFAITVEEKKWLEEKGLELFTRCSECRRKNKLKKEGLQAQAKFILNLNGLISWINFKLEDLESQQTRSGVTEQEHTAREEHIQSLERILSTLKKG